MTPDRQPARRRTIPGGFALASLLFVPMLYIFVASAAWRFRHPWATDTEVLLHLWDAMCWRSTAYEDFRPR